MIYYLKCSSCDHEFVAETHAQCCKCGDSTSWTQLRTGTLEDPRPPRGVAPSVVVKNWGEDYNYTKFGANCSHGALTDKQLERADAKVIRKKRRMAEAKRRVMKTAGMRARGEEVKPLASIPQSMYSAMQQESGDPLYWQHEGKDALKRHGIDF